MRLFVCFYVTLPSVQQNVGNPFGAHNPQHPGSKYDDDLVACYSIHVPSGIVRCGSPYLHNDAAVMSSPLDVSMSLVTVYIYATSSFVRLLVSVS